MGKTQCNIITDIAETTIVEQSNCNCENWSQFSKIIAVQTFSKPTLHATKHMGDTS